MEPTPALDAPLAVRMRPTTLDELVGQQHLLAAGSPLRRLVEGDAPLSVILWGPPGTGKTTIASIVSRATERDFVQLSALTAGVKDVRAVIDQARHRRETAGVATVLFLDEVHRFSKNQQDSLLAAVEDRTIALIAATTENPSFSVISPLLSRSLLLTLQALTTADLDVLVGRALAAEHGLNCTATITADAKAHLIRLADGDARWLLTALEAAAGAAAASDTAQIDLSLLSRTVDRAALRYDADGDQHYDIVSAFIKSIRGSDPDAALHYLARMISAGEDPRFIARRLMVHASEDIGLADPTALAAAVQAAQVVQLVGMPEARLALAQATVHLATAPKSNAIYTAIGSALADVEAGRSGAVPVHLRDAHYPGAKRLGHGAGYTYPHDDPHAVVAQQYLPDSLTGREYYTPTSRGAEKSVGDRLSKLRQIVRRRS